MPKAWDTIALSQLRLDAATALKRIRRSKRPLVVTERGKAAAVLLNIDAYEKGEQEREILKLLARGERDIAAGSGFDLDEVLADADALLSKT